MVRETRYLLVGNLPESTTENEITEYFKRFGKIQKVKLERKPDDTDSDEKEEGCITSLTATVAFTDIKSASNAHKAEKKIGNNVLSSEYSSGFGATGSVVKRTHEPELFPRGPPPPVPFPPNRKGGFDEEADGFDVYYGPTPPYGEPPFGSPQFAERGRPRERWQPGAPFPGRGAKWTPGTVRQFSDSGSKDSFEKPKTTTSIPASSPTASQSSSRQKKKKSKSGDRSQSRSSSNSSRSSSASSDSGSASSSKDRPKGAQVPAVSKCEILDSEIKESEIEPGEREPLGIHIRKLPLRSSDTSLRDGLFHEYKKYGKITAVQISGVSETRYAIISFKQAEDAAKALEASQGRRFFGAPIVVVQHEGIETEDCEFLTPEAQLDEHSPKATRTLFLGNLEKDITIEELKEKLEKYGDILDVDVKRQGAITAYAFIQFTDISSVVKALKDLDGISWGSTKLKVGFGKSMATPVVWLGNLADTVHEGFLCRQFARFGQLSHTVVDKENHRGLVFFLNPESAQYALPEMRNRIWNGKKIHIDYASRDCQDAFFKKMEQSGQLRPGERPDPHWMQKQMANEPRWEEGADPNFKRGGFNQFGRGRGRFQRGRGHFRGRGGGSFEGGYPPDEFAMRRKQLDEFSQGSAPYMDDDSYERQLKEYGHSQRERRERSSQSPPGYEDGYFERGSQSGQDYDNMYEQQPHRYTTYRSLSPASDREMEVNNDDYPPPQYKARTPSDERYYYKEKYYEEGRTRDRSHSSDSEQRYRLATEAARRRSRSRSPTMKLKRTKELPISYRSHTPPTPTDDEPYFHSDNSPSEFDSVYRKYENYRKRPSSVDDDKKSGVLLNTGLRKEIEAKSEERSSRKRSYDQLSPKRSESLQRLERQHSRGSRSESLYDHDREKSAKDLLTKVARLRSELNERTGIKDSPSSGTSSSDIDPSTLTEAELTKLHREKTKLLQKLNVLDNTGNNSDNDSDSRHMSSKKARLDHKYLQKSDSLTKQEIKEKLKLLDETQNYRKLETMRKKDILRELKKSKSAGEMKKDMMDYSEEESYNSPRDYMSKKRRKVDSESDKRSRMYRSRRDDEHGYSSDDDKERQELLRQSSAHADLYSPKSRTLSSLDARLESDVFASHSKEDSRRFSSGSDNNKEQSELSGRSHRRKHKKDNHITPLIPLGDDDMPDPETSDPRPRRGKCERPMILPLPEFAQFIQFSPLPSPSHSPERYSDLPSQRERHHRERATGSGSGDQSPCFSPQSSSSKTHSPSQSPSGSGSDSKGNTNSESGSGDAIPPGFPTETEQIDPDENKVDSLDSIPDPTKVSDEKAKNADDSFSDNNSDIDLSTDNLSIDERIRQLDEKWNKAQAVASITPKVIPDVDSVVGNNTTIPTTLPLYTPPPIVAQGASSPAMSSLYSKYKIRKRNDATGLTSEEAKASEITQTVLSKSSIFDQDSKRLGQSNDFVECKESSPLNDNSPKSYSAWNKNDPKENPMVTVPGSLLDRLGQGSNGSFPTLTVNTTFPSVTNNVNMSLNNPAVSCSSGLYNYEKMDKLSPLVNMDLADKNFENQNISVPYNNKGADDIIEDYNSIRDQSKLDLTNDKLIHLDNNIDKSDVNELTDNDKLDLTTDSLSKPEIDTIKTEHVDSAKENNGSINDSATSAVKVKEEIEPVKTGSEEIVKNDIKSENNLDNLDLKNESVNSDIKKDFEEMDTSGAECVDSKPVLAKSAMVDTIKQENNVDVKANLKQEHSDSKDVIGTNIQSSKDSGQDKIDTKVNELKTEIPNEVKIKSILKKPSESESFDQTEIKMEIDPPKEVVKHVEKSSSDKPTEKDKHLHKQSSTKSDKDDSIKEPSSKKVKLSKDKEKRSDSSHRDDKHKKKDSEKKSESSHKSSSSSSSSADKKDEKSKDKHKSKSDKKEVDKKSSSSSKEEKKDSKDEKKKKSDKKEKDKKDDKSAKETKDDKAEKTTKDKKDEKSEKTEKKDKSEKKDKHEKKEKDGHKHSSKHGLKSPDKKSKSSHKETENKENSKDKAKDKETGAKEQTPKESTSKEGEKDTKPEVKEKEKEKPEKPKKEKEHKSSSHKVKKSKDEASSSSKKSKDEGETKDSKKSKESKEESSESKKNKEDETKKVKDDHNEHKKKDETNNRNNKDSPDKSKDANRKESSEKKGSEKAKEKASGEKCKEEKSKGKEKENKDKDPDHSKSSKSKPSSADSVEKPKIHCNDTKAEKTDADKDDSKKTDSKKEEKKSKDAEIVKNSNSASKQSTKDSEKKSHKIDKAEKSSKIKSNEAKSKNKSPDSSSKSKKETPKKRDREREREERDGDSPGECHGDGLTEEDRLIFAQFQDEPYMSMYDKVKRRSTVKKLHCEKEQEEQKKLLHEYKRGHKVKKSSLSDITESSEMSSDEEKKKSNCIQKSRKKFVFSSDDSDSSTDTNVLETKNNKAKAQIKKPKRILDIYSSDSEEEEMSAKTPTKKSVSSKKKKADVHRDSDHKFDFDSISDSDNKTSATQQAKAKTVAKTNKKQLKPKPEPKSTPKNIKKDLTPSKPKLPRKDLNFKDLFSDDSDESMLSDSDSDSDIMITSKNKKKSFLTNHRNDKNKKLLPRGSSIYTSSEESETDDDFRPMSPPKTTVLPKKVEKKDNFFKEPIIRKDRESDSFSSDHDDRFYEKTKKGVKVNHKSLSDSFDSDGHSSDHQITKFKDKKNHKTDHNLNLDSDLERKLKKQNAKEIKELHKMKNNKKFSDIITDDHRFQNLSKMEIAKVYSETLYEKDSLLSKDTLLSNLTNKDNVPPILTDITKEPLFKLDMEHVRNDIPTLKDINLDTSGKTKNKKHKKENKKKKKNKDKIGRDGSKDRHDPPNNKKTLDVKPEVQKTEDKSENWIPADSDSENTAANGVNRNLFEVLKSPGPNDGKKSHKKQKEIKEEIKHHVTEKHEHEREKISDHELVSDSERKKATANERKRQVSGKSSSKKDLSADVFDFDDEDHGIKPIKESHMKIIKPDSYEVKVQPDNDKDESSNIPIEIQGVEIEYSTIEHDYKDEGNVCPEVETTEVVIEQIVEEKVEKEKAKPKKRRGRKNSGKDVEGADFTQEAVSALVKDERPPVEDIQTEIVQFDTPVSNEQELVIDEGVSLHVEDETDKAVASIVNDVSDETAKAVESILLDGMPGMPTYAISEPVEPTPQLDQNYLQPEFAPSLPNPVPQVGTEVETNTTNGLKGKKGRKGRRTKSGQGDNLLNETAGKMVDGKPTFDLLNDNSFTSVISNPLDANDDDDDGRLQIDFDPPKPEAKQKKPRKPKQTKANKMNDAAVLAAENKLDNLFPNFHPGQDKEGELNRDSLSSESSELERSKHEDLLFMDREDQRHDSDMMSPDERSTSDDLTSPTDVTKVKPKRGRKPKNKEPVAAPIPRTNSPRASRTLSPRSPRNNFDPRSPKSDSFDAKMNGPKSLVIDEGIDAKGNKLSVNVFDFDDNDETGANTAPQVTAATTPKRKPYRRRKGEGMQSPNRGLFSSPEHKPEDKLIIASPESNGLFSPEHKVTYPMEKKGLFSPSSFQPEDQKIEVKSVTDDNKPPEPLFKAFFEAKPKADIDLEKWNPLLTRKNSKDGDNVVSAAQIISNVEKTIDDVAKGLFESTDDEAVTGPADPALSQKKRQTKKTKEEDMNIKSPGAKSPIKSPVAKSPVVKSPVVNPLNNPLNSPPSSAAPMPGHPGMHHQPLLLPGMGIGQPVISQAQIGEPQLAGHVPMLSPPISMASVRPTAPGQHPGHPGQMVQPEASKSQEVMFKNMMSPSKSVCPPSPVKTTILQSPPRSAPISTMAQSSAATTVSPSTATDSTPNADHPEHAMEGALKGVMSGFLVPGISANTAMNVVQGISTAPTTMSQPTTVLSSMSDLQKKQQMDQLAQEQQQMQLQQQQKEAELQRQQKMQIQLKERELKAQEQQRKQMERMQEELKSKEEKKKQLEMLHEQLQRQKAMAGGGITVGPGGQPGQPGPLLSPGGMPGPRASLPSPGDKGQGPRPQMPAQQLPPGGMFGLPGHHPGGPPLRPGQIPAHWTPAQLQAMQQLVPLGQEKPPTSVEMIMKHQQLQQQIAAQAQAAQQVAQAQAVQAQKVQAQALAEQQAQMAKQQAQQAQAQAKQTAQQVEKIGPAQKGAANSQTNKKAVELQRPPVTSQAPPQGVPGKDTPLPGSQEAANQLTEQIRQTLAMQAKQQQQGHPGAPDQGHQGSLPGQQGHPGALPGQPGHPGALPGQPGHPGALPGQPGHPGALPGQPGHPGALPGQPGHPGALPGQPGHPGAPPPHVQHPPHGQHPQHPGLALHGWQMQHMRPENPRQPGPGGPMGPMLSEVRTSMPGPVPILGGNPQQVQRVSPHPPTKSPTVAQTAPNMVHGFSHQSAAPRAPSPAVAKTAERPGPSGGGAKWASTNGAPPRPGQSDVRPPRVSASETGPATSRPEQWTTMNGPTVQPSPGLSPAPRPAHQQPPSAHQHQPEHALQLTHQPAPNTSTDRANNNKDKFLQQQKQMELQRQEMLSIQELQRAQLREQALHAQAQKEVAIHKERERAESLEREKREAHAGSSDPRQSPAIRGMPGYPFVEPRPPSPNGKHPQSPAIDPRDPRYAQQFAGHHPTDLRLGSSQTSAFSPAAGAGQDAAHMYTPTELQRLQQNGLLPYPHSLMMREPHLIPGHAPPYMLPGGVHLAYVAQQMEHQQHLVDGRPPSKGQSRPPSNQAVHTVSPSQQQQQQQQQQDNRGQNRQAPPGQTMGPPTGRDPHPGDGSLLSLLQRYPVMWQGILGLKNDQCVVQMHFISGFQPLVKMSLPQQAADGTVQPLRIAQRMRLEQAQLEGVEKRMQMEKDYCMMLALPCGRDHTDIYQQTRAMSTGFIQYLQQKQAAGIVNVADPGSQQPAYVVHIFPPCDFSQTTLSRLGFDLLYQVKDLAHLIVIIATVA